MLHATLTRALIRAAVVVAVVPMVLAGCTDDDERLGPAGDPSVLTTAGDPDLVTEDFEGIALYPGSEPVGARSEVDGVVTQSFVVPDVSPAEVLSHFQNFVEEQRGDVEDVGDATRLEFRTAEGRRLEVSVTDMTGSATEVGTGVQYSLVLHPR